MFDNRVEDLVDRRGGELQALGLNHAMRLNGVGREGVVDHPDNPRSCCAQPGLKSSRRDRSLVNVNCGTDNEPPMNDGDKRRVSLQRRIASRSSVRNF
jgi:hypothetical protein